MSSAEIKRTSTNRLPAPALFVGPPSRNASNTSLLPPGPETGKPTRTPLTRQRSLLGQDGKRPLPPTTRNTEYDGELLSVTSSNLSAPFIRQQKQANEAADAEANNRAEAIWAEMQNTLEEVELSAIKGPGMTVFGSEHSMALDHLRRAQIDLAKAWARSEAEESGQSTLERQSAAGTDATDMLASDRTQKLHGHPSHSRSSSTAKNTRSRAESGAIESGLERSRLEEETERDIELSRKRREANDRYFEKVNKGVLEVVMRLEEVARAMKGVEKESQEIWKDDGASVDGDGAESVTTAPSVT